MPVITGYWDAGHAYLHHICDEFSQNIAQTTCPASSLELLAFKHAITSTLGWVSWASSSTLVLIPFHSFGFIRGHLHRSETALVRIRQEHSSPALLRGRRLNDGRCCMKARPACVMWQSHAFECANVAATGNLRIQFRLSRGRAWLPPPGPNARPRRD